MSNSKKGQCQIEVTLLAHDPAGGDTDGNNSLEIVKRKVQMTATDTQREKAKSDK